MPPLYGFLAMFLAAFSYGAAGVVIKIGYIHTQLTPDSLLALQNGVAIIGLWVLAFITGSIVKLSKKQITQLTVQGFFGNLALSACYFWAAQLIDVSLLTIILFTYPAVVIVYKMIAENKQVLKVEWLALFMVIVGSVLAVDPFRSYFEQVDKFGLLLAFGAMMANAFLNIFGEKISSGNLKPQLITAFTVTVSLVGLCLFISPLEVVSKALTYSYSEWLIIFSMAILCCILPLILMYIAIQLVGSFYVSIISVFEVPCILVLASIILKEEMNGLQLLGGALIIISIFILQFKGRPDRPGLKANQ